MMCNGMLAGLVAITAPCAFVDSWAAVRDRRASPACWSCSACSSGTHRGIDDPVGAISVHGVNGLWGVISRRHLRQRQVRRRLERRGPRIECVDDVRLRRRARPVLRRRSQFMAQLLDAAVCRLRLRHGVRVVQDQQPDHADARAADVEMEGLDMPEMGALGYPDFMPAASCLTFDTESRRRLRAARRTRTFGDRTGPRRVQERMLSTWADATPPKSSYPLFDHKRTCEHFGREGCYMKKIEAIVRHHKVDEVKEALVGVGLTGMTVSRSPRLRPAAGAHGNLSRHGVHRRFRAESEDRNRRERRHCRQGVVGDRRRGEDGPGRRREDIRHRPGRRRFACGRAKRARRLFKSGCKSVLPGSSA